MERLRRYLEQRREMGETELVLDTLGVDEAMRLLGAGFVTPPREAAPSTPPAPASGEPVGDWRDALRAAGAAPDQRRAEGKEAGDAGAKTTPAASGTPFDNVPRTRQPLPPVPSSSAASASPSTNDSSSPAPTGGDSIEKIAADVAICTRCPLYETATHPVPGEGNPHADLMCVGEAPGATEDETGRPFVGAAGQLLTKILEAIRLPREQVFICNVLKHRPPGNRNPLPDEVLACNPFLVRQIELVRPKVILALGSFAAQTLLQSKLSLGKLRGQVHQYHGVPVVVTYHPAALLRNPSWKRPTWEDVQLARRILDRADQSGA